MNRRGSLLAELDGVGRVGRASGGVAATWPAVGGARAGHGASRA
jgi:hypothetical protein